MSSLAAVHVVSVAVHDVTFASWTFDHDLQEVTEFASLEVGDEAGTDWRSPVGLDEVSGPTVSIDYGVPLADVAQWRVLASPDITFSPPGVLDVPASGFTE